MTEIDTKLWKKRFQHIPVLQTPRLYLRRMTPHDAADMYDYARLPQVTEYLLWRPHPSKAYTAQYLSQIQADYRAGRFFDWGIIDRQSDRLIGTCGFTTLDFANFVGEIGYVLHPAFSGRGLATEAATEVMKFGFYEIGLHRVEAHYMAENMQSLRVMERLGMHPEGIHRAMLFVKGAFRDIGICAILREEFEAIYGTKADHRIDWHARMR